MGAFLAAQRVNFGESGACQSAMGAVVHDGPGEPCLISRTSTTVNLQRSLVRGLFESPSPQAMTGSLSMHGSCHIR